MSIAGASPTAAAENQRPNIVLVMADDMGWGQTGYYSHPVLKTPHLDAMAESGLRFDRFYAGAPVCSPTRASVLTGRANDRTGVKSHGYPLRLQERTIARVLKEAGYVTGHFGKWHLNGLRGPGVPILASDDHHPGHFGFDHWLSVTNFFDRDPILSRRGKFEEHQGDSSEIVVDEALKFARRQTGNNQPFLAVIWYGTPHRPFMAAEEDMEPFGELDEKSKQHYGELVAMDRSVGALRQGLRELNVADNTLVWFCSDNGGLPGIEPGTVGGLRGHKGTIYEGGLRVPAIVEWPAGITRPRATDYPACTMDIYPTLVDVVGVEDPETLTPQDGLSLKKLFRQEADNRPKPIPFRHIGRAALVDGDYKLLTTNLDGGEYELYDLGNDPGETTNIAERQPETFRRLRTALQQWSDSVDASVAGKDYPAGQVQPGEPEPRFWTELEAYQVHFPQWKQRPEYGDWIRRRMKRAENRSN